MASTTMDSKILITGATGLIGTNLVAGMRQAGYRNIVPTGIEDVDLTDFRQTQQLFEKHKPEIVIHLAAMVGGIFANSTRLCDFYEVNTLINTNVLIAARKFGVRKVHAMGTGCAYPKRLEGQMLQEKDFLDGLPEPTNYAYAYAKRNMLVHLMAMHDQYQLPYTCLIPANIYGPYDNFHPKYSHVVPGLLVRFLKAVEEGQQEVKVWGTGRAERDFLYIQDCVEALLCVVNHPDSLGVYNISSGRRYTIRQLAEIIARETNFPGRWGFDTSYPDGQSTRVMSTQRLDELGWHARFTLEQGIRETVAWCRKNPELWKTRGS
ncbi:MAG: GDP-L-fucose synthase [Phycisphaerae bacterium]|jgi:GDP-L-fucose synthase